MQELSQVSVIAIIGNPLLSCARWFLRYGNFHLELLLALGFIHWMFNKSAVGSLGLVGLTVVDKLSCSSLVVLACIDLRCSPSLQGVGLLARRC